MRRFEKSWSWVLGAPRAQLWPILSDTERLNEALGLPRYRLRETIDDFGRRYFGEYDLNDKRVRWEETPMEWAAPHWWQWERRYESGPFERASATLILEEAGPKRTKATYKLTAEPNGTVGRLLVMSGHLGNAAKDFERLAKRAARHCRKPLGDFYSNIAAEAHSKRSGGSSKRNAAFLKDLTAEFRPLCEWITCAPTADMIALRPKRMARALGLEWNEALSLCERAVTNDLLHFRTRLICDSCLKVVVETDAPRKIPPLCGCRHCGAPIRRNLGENVELVFRPDSRLRDIQDAVHCGSAPARTPDRILQQSLGPRERRSFEIKTSGLNLRPRVLNGAVGEWTTTESASGLTVRCGEAWIEATPSDGEIVLENHGEEDAMIVLETEGGDREAIMVADARAVQSWQDRFDSAALDLGQHEPGGNFAILAVRHGDPDTAAVLLDMIVREGGSFFGETDECMILGFLTPEIATKSAQRIRADLPGCAIGACYGEILLSGVTPVPTVSGPPIELAIALATGAENGAFETADSFFDVPLDLTDFADLPNR